MKIGLMRLLGLVRGVWKDCRRVMLARGHDYAGDKDRMANFRQVAAMLRRPEVEVVLALAGTKMARLASLYHNRLENDAKSEPVRDSWRDLVNYATFGYVLDAERSHELQRVEEPLLVYVAGPISTDERGEPVGQEWWPVNRYRAFMWALDVLERGHMPLCPHTMWTPLDETIRFHEWADAHYVVLNFLDLPYVELCDVVLVVGWSKGVRVEVEYAERWGIPVVESVEELPRRAVEPQVVSFVRRARERLAERIQQMEAAAGEGAERAAEDVGGVAGSHAGMGVDPAEADSGRRADECEGEAVGDKAAEGSEAGDT